VFRASNFKKNTSSLVLAVVELSAPRGERRNPAGTAPCSTGLGFILILKDFE
jgi:hypothetical protein